MVTVSSGNILVVDDELTNRMLLSSNLSEKGFVVDVAEDGLQGLELLRSGSYDVVLLDLMMPKMNGYQVLEEMKKDSHLESIPVIVISTDNDMKSIIRCLDLGATDYLPKPFDPALLQIRIDASLALKRLDEQQRRYTGNMLVVDDDIINRTLLATSLGEEGYSVETVQNGFEALELLNTKAFDMVFLDLLMPEMNGFEVLKIMKSQSKLQHIPVIVVSAEEEVESIVRCIELGATDHLPKPFDPVMLHARVKASLATKRLYDQLTSTNLDLQQEITVRKETEEKLRVAEKSATELSEFLKKMFGRYISTEVMTSLIEDPSATELGGENRQVTIMITDLRGFTSISERLRPEQVVRLLNIYFETMVEIVFKYNGTINEISGDSLVVIFGAPKAMPDRTQRTVACAIEMQNAMVEVNRQNRSQDLPEIEMGIGLNEAEVIVGNIGSKRRTKYGAIGSGMNQASRIESYTVGGQIYVSESIVEQIGKFLRIDNQLEVFPKGVGESFNIYDIGGIAGNYNLSLIREESEQLSLSRKIPINCTILEGKHVGESDNKGNIVELSNKSASVIFTQPIEQLVNLKINLDKVDEAFASKVLYAKVIECQNESLNQWLIRFTAVPPEIKSYFLAHLQYSTDN